MPDYGDALGGVSSAVGSLFSGIGAGAQVRGARQAASYYREASEFAEQNALFALTNTEIQRMMSARAFRKVEGKLTAAAGMSGLDLLDSPNVVDALRETSQQQQIESDIISLQGGITENTYRMQAMALLGQESSAQAMAQAARASQRGNFLGGLFSIGRAIFSLF